MNLIYVSISEGLLWGIMALGLFISFRILKIADLTMEGSFPLGASVTAVCIINNVNPLSATLIAFGIGALAGLVTGVLMTRGNIQSLLAGMLTMTALYSINLRIMGRSNISLLNHPRLTQLVSLSPPYNSIVMGVVVVSVLVILLYAFFMTDYGQAMIATGDNERMARAMGISSNHMKIIGLMVSNGCVALSGSFIAQHNGYADISMGIGTIVIGLASVMLAEAVFSNVSFLARLISLSLGSIIYRLIISGALSLGLQPNDLKLVSAGLLTVIISMPMMYKRFVAPLMSNTYREQEATQ